MRKWLILILIGWLALIPAAAFADVDIDVDIHKTRPGRKKLRKNAIWGLLFFISLAR